MSVKSEYLPIFFRFYSADNQSRTFGYFDIFDMLLFVFGVTNIFSIVRLTTFA